MNYYIAQAGGSQKGPFPPEQLLAQGCRPESLVWAEGMAQWLRADSVAELQGLFARPVVAAPPPAAMGQPMPAPGQINPPVGYQAPPPRQGDNNKMAAGLCGILLGGLGIHKFILGMNGAGLTMLLVTVLTCGFGGIVMGPIGLIEGIIYLTKSDEEFYQTYVVGKKAWF